MKVYTTRFGEIEIADDTIISFPSGILGFPNYTKYALVDLDENSPLKWLQSMEEPSLAFVVTNPNLFMSSYSIDATRKDLADIAVEHANDVIVLVLVTVPKDPAQMTANFKGPVLINSKNHLGKQLIVDNPDYDIKYRLLPEEMIENVI
jgi:flagellar assembly factor FliW